MWANEPANRIVGELIAQDKYKFVNHALVAEIVHDVMAIIEHSVEEQMGGNSD